METPQFVAARRAAPTRVIAAGIYVALLLAVIGVGRVMSIGEGEQAAPTNTDRFGTVHADVFINADRSAEVIMQMPVHVTGAKLKHGFALSFPRIMSAYGRTVKQRLAYEFLRVTRQPSGGAAEEIFFRTNQSAVGDTLLELGDRDGPELAPGEYLYTVHYRLNGAVRIEPEFEGLSFYPFMMLPMAADALEVSVVVPPGTDARTLKGQTFALRAQNAPGASRDLFALVESPGEQAELAAAPVMKDRFGAPRVAAIYRSSHGALERDGIRIEVTWAPLGGLYWGGH